MCSSFIQDFSCYSIHFDGDDDAKRESASWLSDELGVPVGANADAEIEEDGKHTHVEDFWDWLEPYAAGHRGASFTLEGYITNHGFDEDFRIVVSDGALSAYRSGWYEGLAKDRYEDFEDFCECYQDDDGNPICTEEEFEALGEDIFIFELTSSDKPIVLGEVPLDGPATSRDGLKQIGISWREDDGWVSAFVKEGYARAYARTETN